jgi:hypothetical protein
MRRNLNIARAGIIVGAQSNELQFSEARVFETIAVLSMIFFASVGTGLFIMNRQATQEEARKQAQDDHTP